jgi:UDP-N-acetyl-D-mannosaminuronate dehydrogenase
MAYIEDPQKLLESVEAVVIATEWPQYQKLDYRGKIVVDRRRIERGQETKKLCRYSDLLPALKNGFLFWGLGC